MSKRLRFNGTFFITSIFFVIALSLTLTTLNNNEDYYNDMRAVGGMIELPESQDDFIVPLEGQWFFYDKQLLTTFESSNYDLV